MINKLTNNIFYAIGFAAVIIGIHAWSTGRTGQLFVLENIVLLLMGITLDFICKRFRIIGRKSHLALVVFALLTVLIMPILSFKSLVVGFIWLVAVSLAFSSWEDQNKSRNNLIYIGVLLGIAQTLDHYSVLLFVPFFVLFYQNAVLQISHYLLSIFYFLLVLLSYVGILFVMDLLSASWYLIPNLHFDYSNFSIPLIRTLLPVLVIMIIVHLLNLRSYTFRYPNRNIVINMLFALQLLFAAILVLLSSANSLFILMTLPASILLAVGFTFKQESVFVKVAFITVVSISLAASIFFNYYLV